MIVIKEKGNNSQIYIQRNEITSLPSSNSGIDEEELAKYLEGYATEEYVNEKVNDIDLSDYATKEYVDDSVVELTKEEYEQLKLQNKIEDKKIYLITDSTIPLKTINGESIIGEGNIDIDLSDYATTEYVNNQLGNVETILDNIIGE